MQKPLFTTSFQNNNNFIRLLAENGGENLAVIFRQRIEQNLIVIVSNGTRIA